MTQPKSKAISGFFQPLKMLCIALCLLSLKIPLHATPPSGDSIPSFEPVPTICATANAECKQYAGASAASSIGESCKTLCLRSLSVQVTKMIGIGKRDKTLAKRDSSLTEADGGANSETPELNWLDAALQEKSKQEENSRQDAANDPNPVVWNASVKPLKSTLAEPITSHTDIIPVTAPADGQFAIAQGRAQSVAVTLAAIEIAPDTTFAESDPTVADSLIDIPIPDIFSSSESTHAKPIASASISTTTGTTDSTSLTSTQSSENPPNAAKASIAKATSGAGVPAIRMQVGKAKHLQTPEHEPAQAAKDSNAATSGKVQNAIASNSVVIAVGDDEGLQSSNYRLNDAPVDSTGVIVNSSDLHRLRPDSLGTRLTDGQDSSQAKSNSEEALSMIPARGTLLSSGSDNKLSIRIGTTKPSDKPSDTLSSNMPGVPLPASSGASVDEISDWSELVAERESVKRPEPIVKAIQPARHSISDESLSFSEHNSFASIVARLPEGNNPEPVDIQLRNFKSLELDGAVVAFQIEDETVCQIVKTGKKTLSAIGLASGTTRVAVIQESAGDRSTRVYAVRVASANDSSDTLSQLAQELTRTLRALHATSKIEVYANRQELTVRGLASSEEEAQAILSFVRRTTLRPVVDRVVTRR